MISTVPNLRLESACAILPQAEAKSVSLGCCMSIFTVAVLIWLMQAACQCFDMIFYLYKSVVYVATGKFVGINSVVFGEFKLLYMTYEYQIW